MLTRTQSVVTAGAVPSTGGRLVRPRTSFEHYIPALMKLYQDNTDALYMSGFDPAKVLAELAAYASSMLAQQAAYVAYKKQQSVTAMHASNAWTATLALYARAKEVARTNPEIKQAIAEFERFMHVKRARRPKTPAGGSTPPVAA
jgi:hypothetical protein